MSRTRRACVPPGLVAVLCAVTSWSQPAPTPPAPSRAADRGNCGWRSVLGLAELRSGAAPTSAALDAYRDRPSSTLAEVKVMADRLGLPLRLVRLAPKELADLPLPALVHAREPSHFSVLLGVSPERVWLWDGPGKKIESVARPAFEKVFSGYAGRVEPAGGEGAPRLVVAAAHVDLGDCTGQLKVRHEFRCTNQGGAPLELSVLRTSCGCTSVALNPPRLAPGASGVVTVESTAGEPGPFTQEVILRTNDPSHGRFLLSLSGHANAAAVVLDRSAVVVSAWCGEPQRQTLRVYGPPDLTVLSAECEPALFEVVARERATPPGRAVCTLEAIIDAARPTAAAREGTLTILTNQAATPRLTVPVYLLVRPSLETSPPDLFWGAVRPGGPYEKTVEVRHRLGRPFRVVGVSADRPEVTVGAQVELAPGRWSFTVRFAPTGRGLAQATVRVRTDRPGEEELRLPLTALVEP
jgi:hypothetical protein